MKILTTQLLIFALLTVSLRVSIIAQAQPVPIAEGSIASANTAENASSEKPDLKSVFDKKTKELRDRSPFFDLKKAEKEERLRQAKPKHWDKKTTVLVLVLVSIGAAVGIYFLAKYAKDCLKYDPPDCDPFYEDTCTCSEYAPRKK